jgi:hypothetical protein
MRFGVLVTREFTEYTDANLPILIEELTRLGCLHHNIVVKDMPSEHSLHGWRQWGAHRFYESGK